MLAASDNYQLRLYVVGNTGKSMVAQRNLLDFCREHLIGKYILEIIDLLLHPHLAAEESIFAIPTLIKKSPEPTKRLVGDLSNKEKVLLQLGISANN